MRQGRELIGYGVRLAYLIGMNVQARFCTT